MLAAPGLSIAGILLLLSVLLSVAFFVYGLNTLHLTLRSRRYRLPEMAPLTSRPPVAIHLPIYNELYVVGRLLKSCVGVADRYGMGLVRIFVIDDSTDETREEIDRLASDYSAQGYKFKVIRRGSRAGFKAGALQTALEQTQETYVAILDADFVPPADFLERTVSVMENDADVGFVQGRWGHLDRNYNTVTESVAIGVDAHFYLEQQGRNGSGYLMNFNGSAGVLRTDAIRKAGGWASDTLAEDLDVSYRIQLGGYRGVYLNDLEVPAEVPPTIASIKRQQGRWARGSLQTAKKLLGRIWRTKNLSTGQKVEAGIHLTYYLVHPLMVASFILVVVADFLSLDAIRYGVQVGVPTLSMASGSASITIETIQVVPWLVFSALIVLSTLSVLMYCVQAVRVQKLGLFANLRKIAFLVVLGYGMSISNSVQALNGLLSSETGTFSRTPKYAVVHTGEDWSKKKYQIPLNSTTFLEAGAVVLAIFASGWAVLTGNLGILPILFVYLTGYAFILYLTIRQKIESGGHRDA
ncbi:MAG: glycosyltransferase [Thaumarchaeota archaeon]|nr:glycosyltransferase [Nitrososphaerota archaeon]